MTQSAGQGQLLGSLSSGLLSLVTFQLFARLLTFTLNIVIARTVDRAAFGIGSVQVGGHDTVPVFSACSRFSSPEGAVSHVVPCPFVL